MPDIFINYRTGDEEGSATAIDQELSRRFGSDQVFRASKSIALGEDYLHQLPAAVRRSEVLLAVIGSRWLTARDQRGRKCLDNENDWIRKEILEAFEHSVRVVPVLIGGAPRLDPSDLPPELAKLTNCQYHRLDHRSSEADLRALGDKLVRLVPSLAARDRARESAEPDAAASDSVRMRAGDRAHQQIGATRTVVNNSHGPVHTGSGDQLTFAGDGVNYVTGGDIGGIQQNFRPARKRRRKRPDGS
ncbi:MAG: toll/interleukin-1 receptor domain-containing protein [Pseudonocardiaceae bacterium]